MKQTSKILLILYFVYFIIVGNKEILFPKNTINISFKNDILDIEAIVDIKASYTLADLLLFKFSSNKKYHLGKLLIHNKTNEKMKFDLSKLKLYKNNNILVTYYNSLASHINYVNIEEKKTVEIPVYFVNKMNKNLLIDKGFLMELYSRE